MARPSFFLLLWVISSSLFAADMSDVKGLIRLKEFDQAVVVLRPLAEAGMPQAQYQMGSMFRMGTGVAKDHQKAVRWFLLAADQGHGQAQYSLGLMYLNGWGATLDRAKAHHWLTLAATGGHRLAPRKLTELATHKVVSSESLFRLIRLNDQQGLKQAFESGSPIDTQDTFGQTLLMAAVRDNNREIIDMLLKRDIVINATDKLGDTALILAVRKNYSAATAALIKGGANLNHVDSNGNSPLMIALQLDYADVAKQLLDARPSLQLRNSAGESVTDIADRRESDDFVVILLNRGAPARVDHKNAARPVDTTIDAILQGVANNNGGTEAWPPLMVAISRNKPEWVSLLIARGEDVQFHGASGNSPIRLAVTNGQTNIVQLLLDAHVSLETPHDVHQPTILDIAIRQGSVAIVKLLLAAGAPVNSISSNGWSLLMRAARSGDKDILESLIQKNVKVNQVNNVGDTALMIATREGWLAGTVSLIKAGANPSRRNKEDQSALSIAIVMDYPEIISRLLQESQAVADNRYTDKTALMLASSIGNSDVLEQLLKLDTSNIDAIDAVGNTALIIAVLAGNESAINTLIQNGADRNRRNHNRDSAIELAHRSGDDLLIKALEGVKTGSDWW